MIPAYWYHALFLYLWQVSVHSLVIAVIGMAWLRRLRLPSGVARRQVLALILVLPLVTAAVPGRDSTSFRGSTAWVDSHRFLSLPLAGGLRVYHLALMLAALVVVLTVWQELLPVLRRWRSTSDPPPPAELVGFARSLQGWGSCRVDVRSTNRVLVATGGWPRRPRLHLSRGALRVLDDEEIRIVIRHEHAHWIDWRWTAAHLLYVARLVQILNPVALWAFREYIEELEIACDLSAIDGRDAKPLARALFKIYRASKPAEMSVRASMRRRIEVLTGRLETSSWSLPVPTAGAIVLILLVLMPWIV